MIDRYITAQIKKRGITLYDIIGGPSVDPEPQNWAKPFNERVRPNRFKSRYWDLRLCELLTKGNFNSQRPYENLAIPLKYIVRYWWNNIADQEAFLESAFEDILILYKDRMLPEKPEEKPVDVSDSIDELVEAIE